MLHCRRVHFADQHAPPRSATAQPLALPCRSVLRKRKAAEALQQRVASPLQPSPQLSAVAAAAAAQLLAADQTEAITKERLVRALGATLAADPTSSLRRAEGARLLAELLRKRRQQQVSTSDAAAVVSNAACSTAAHAAALIHATPSASDSASETSIC